MPGSSLPTARTSYLVPRTSYLVPRTSYLAIGGSFLSTLLLAPSYLPATTCNWWLTARSSLTAGTDRQKTGWRASRENNDNTKKAGRRPPRGSGLSRLSPTKGEAFSLKRERAIRATGKKKEISSRRSKKARAEKGRNERRHQVATYLMNEVYKKLRVLSVLRHCQKLLAIYDNCTQQVGKRGVCSISNSMLEKPILI